jgi:hypothetical protein
MEAVEQKARRNTDGERLEDSGQPLPEMGELGQ